MTAGTKLKPCANCQSDAGRMLKNTTQQNSYAVQCCKCGMKTPWMNTQKEADDIWNRREPVRYASYWIHGGGGIGKGEAIGVGGGTESQKHDQKDRKKTNGMLSFLDVVVFIIFYALIISVMVYWGWAWILEFGRMW